MKNYPKILGFLGIGVLSLFLVAGYDRLSKIQAGNPSQANQSIQLTVSAAASLTDVMKEIELLYEQKYPQTELIYNFASSGSLQRQIEQGAPVDIFISAASSKMDALEKQNLILTETRQDLLQNQMVLVSPEGNSKNNLKLDNFEDLTDKQIKTIALGEPESVPAGKYAQEVLQSFKIADKVNSKAVYGKDVRQIINYVATGNVDAAIVYRTDAQNADLAKGEPFHDRVRVVATAPETSHSPVVYPIAVVSDSDRTIAANQLIEFLTTPEARAVFEEYGFVINR